MATTSGTFTTVNQTIVHPPMRRGEQITVNISDTYDQVIEFQRATTKSQLAWVTIKKFNTEDATELFHYVVDSQEEILRLWLSTDDGGSASVSIVDSDQVLHVARDSQGNEIYRVTQAGIVFPKTLTVDGAATITGALTQTGNVALAGTLDVVGAIQADAALNVDGAATLTSTLGVTGDVQADAALNVDGAATLTDTLVVTGLATMTAALTQTVAGVPLADLGVVNGTGVSLVEGGNNAFHKTTFTLASAVIPTATTGDGEVGTGGLKLYDFPEGNILILGITGDLSSLIASADQSKLADNASTGDFGIGSIIPANNDALGTDPTDDDFSGTVAFVNTAHADSDISMLTLDPHTFVDDGSDLDLILTAGIDTADITDTGGAVTVGIEMTGEITLIWCNLGTLE